MVTVLRHPPDYIASEIAEAAMTLIAAATFEHSLSCLPHPVVAARIYRQRRVRDRVFGAQADTFGDPAWDILLDLCASSEPRKRISVSSACIAARVPPATALRHLARLVEQGFVERLADNVDRRRVFVQLTKHGQALMQECLADISGDACR